MMTFGKIGTRKLLTNKKWLEELMYKEYYMALVSMQPIDTIVDEVTTNLGGGAFQTLNTATGKPIRKIVFKNDIVGQTNCFSGNYALEELVFEKNVSLSTWSLQNCAGLKVFRIGGTTTGLGSYAFQNAHADLNVYVPNMTFSAFIAKTSSIQAYAPATAIFHMQDGDFYRDGTPVTA